jgi:hypothetical protein
LEYIGGKKVNTKTKRWFKDVGLGFRTPAGEFVGIMGLSGTVPGTVMEWMDGNHSGEMNVGGMSGSEDAGRGKRMEELLDQEPCRLISYPRPTASP